MREIKFRAWNKDSCVWQRMFNITSDGRFTIGNGADYSNKIILMQYTGLKDKNRLQEVYEGDIIDTYGNIKGNIYEIKKVDKDRYDLVIQGFGTKDWLTTYQNAVDRGCKDSE